MGSGKSTIGSILANVLGLHFLDLDDEIEKQTGIPISEIFALHGEAYFREIEHKALLETTKLPEALVSLGGGALAQARNLQYLKEKGIIVYLRVSASELANRLQHTPNKRPLIQDEQGNLLPYHDLQKRIATLLEKRASFYEQAHLIIDLDRLSIGTAVDMVAKVIMQYQKSPLSPHQT